MSETRGKYTKSTPEGRLWQGEIVSNLPQARIDLDSLASPHTAVMREKIHPFAVILTQDCDLESEFRKRVENPAITSLPNILFCEAITVSELRKNTPKGKDFWKTIIQNKNERYHCLEAIPADTDAANDGTDHLGIDFKRYFTLPTGEIYERLKSEGVARRARLNSEYAQHLVSRFYYFQQRVALPDDHEIPLSPAT